MQLRSARPLMVSGSLPGGAAKNSALPRPCGWAVHRIGATQLPEPLCIQRPLQGCFNAFATPDEIAHHLPRGYWRAPVEDRGCTIDPLAPQTMGSEERASEKRAACARSDLPPRVQLPRATPRGVPRKALAHRLRRLNRLRREADGVAIEYESLTAEGLLELLRRFRLPEPVVSALRDAHEENDTAIAPVLLLAAPAPAALRQQPILTRVNLFDIAFNQIKKVTGWGPLAVDWWSCMKMMRHNKCTSVC